MERRYHVALFHLFSKPTFGPLRFTNRLLDFGLSFDHQISQFPVYGGPCVSDLRRKSVLKDLAHRTQKILTNHSILLRLDIETRVLLTDLLDSRQRHPKIVNIRSVGVQDCC